MIFRVLRMDGFLKDLITKSVVKGAFLLPTFVYHLLEKTIKMKKIIRLLTCVLSGIGAYAQTPFSQDLSPSSNNESIRLDCRQFVGNYKSTKDFVDILAVSGDCTVYDYKKGAFAPMKGNISSIYMYQDQTSGILGDSLATVYATIDKNQKDEVLGDGGGLISFSIQRNASTNEWQVVSTDNIGGKDVFFTNVSFDKVGGTIGNQDFTFSSTLTGTTQRFVITENVENIHSNKDLVGFKDTSDYAFPAAITKTAKPRSVIPDGTTVKKFQSLGWPIEVDGVTGEVIDKVHRLGRGVTAIGTNGVSFYFAYGGNPSVLMQYTTLAPLPSTLNLDLPKGDGDVVNEGDGNIYLYAFKQNADGTGAFSIPICFKVDSVLDPDNLPHLKGKYFQVFDSLVVAKDVALRAGATMFANIGDIEVTTDSEGNSPVLVISEKGIDDSGDWYSHPSKKYNGVLASHLQALDKKDGTEDGHFSDPYGRILTTDQFYTYNVTTLIEGGQNNAKGSFFSNPDKMELVNTDLYDNLNTVLIVKENIPATTLGRNPSGTSFDQRVNEAYFVELDGSSNQYQGLPLDYGSTIAVASIPVDSFHLFQSGSNGSKLSSSGTTGIFLGNRSRKNGKDYDSYLTVVNGYSGTDKSMILSVRNIYPEGACLPVDPLGFFNEEAWNESSLFKAWPNPTNGILHVSEVANYSVSDVTGNSLKSFTNTAVLDLSEFEKGIYFVKKEGGAVKKIVLN